ncbi:MAG: signal transduction histidine kinase [Planctomycetota bacterium]|jgi:signal transduction histidine kinase
MGAEGECQPRKGGRVRLARMADGCVQVRVRPWAVVGFNRAEKLGGTMLRLLLRQPAHLEFAVSYGHWFLGRPMSIRRRATIVFLVVNAITLALIAASVFNETRGARNRLKADRESIAKGTAEVLANSFKVSLEIELLRALEKSLDRKKDQDEYDEFAIALALSDLKYWDEDPLVTKYLDRVFFVRFSESDINRFNPRPRLIMDAEESAKLSKSFLRERVARANGIETFLDEKGQVVVYGKVDPTVSPDWGYYFRMNLIESEGFDPVESVRRILFYAIPGMLILLAMLYYFLNRLVLIPLSETEKAAVRISSGDYDQPIAFASRNDEIGSVARAMNAMMAQLAEYRTRMQGNIHAATERFKRAEQHLVVSERLAAMGRIAAGIAHEINNPLGGILNAIRRLGSPDLPEDRREKYQNVAEDAVRRIQSTVQRVLATSPRHTPQVETVKILSSVEQAKELVAHKTRQSQIELKIDVADSLEVVGDPNELSQIFLNLLINACAAVSERSKPLIEVLGEEIGDEVLITVKDNGMGMTAEVKEHVFDLFFTTKSGNKGTGLGLGIVHNMVTGHGGRISVESTPEEGSIFRLYLPRRRPE